MAILPKESSILFSGVPTCGEWSQLCWVKGTISLAVRQGRDDQQWYVTVGLTTYVRVLHGPIPTKDAAEMVVVMMEGDRYGGAVDKPAVRST